MKRLGLVFVVACGGGPSVGDVVNPSTRIVGSNCQLTGQNSISIDVTYQTELAVGGRWEAVALVGSNFTVSENNVFSCGSWTPTGFGQSAKGCQRDSQDQPPDEQLTHMHTETFQDPLIAPVLVTLIGNTFDGDVSEASDSDDIECF